MISAVRWVPPIMAILGLVYRRSLYWKIPVHPGDPYGLGDIIDGMFGLLLVIVCAIAVLAGVWEFAHKKNGVWHLVSAVGSYAAYFALH